MSTTTKRTARKRAAVTYAISDSESEDEKTPPKKTKKTTLNAAKKAKIDKTETDGKTTKQTNKKPTKKQTAVNDADDAIRTRTETIDTNILAEKTASQNVSQRKLSLQSNRKTWSDKELLAELKSLNLATSANIVKLFDEGNTIPFMCRYRRELIGNFDADEMRDIKTTYNHIKNIRARSETIIKDLTKRDLLDDEIKHEILSAKSLDALDHLYAPFKTTSKSSLFERAKALGLEKAAEAILYESHTSIKLSDFIQKGNEGVSDIEKVKEGIKNIISHIFSKDTDVLEVIQNVLGRNNSGIKIESSENTKATKAHKLETSKVEQKKGDKKHGDNPQKFEIYFNFQCYLNNIQSHQTLAINRGENLKFLNVKIVIPDRIQNEICWLLKKKYFINEGRQDCKHILEAALNEAYSKKLKPLMNRQIRSLMTKNAEKTSVEMFGKNLKQLLLIKPVKGQRILGIDPGFRNGCKLALISEQNDVLDTDVIYPHTGKDQRMTYENRLINLLRKHNCELIAIGNGTACRETETWVGGLIADNMFHSKSVQYCIVSENGASIYSCSDVAKKEFPKMDVNMISAVSIARRLSDPLAELVKIEPQHLGVGMYQHDINKKYLVESLDEVISECVSFVGVDINTASAEILRHISGMNSARAENVIKYRSENGPFKSREEVKKVKSIGEKTFEQCAGFIRIEFTTAANDKYNIFDATWVHPESYTLAKKIITNLHLSLKEIGTKQFIARIEQTRSERGVTQKMATEFRVPEERIESILEALARELQKDYRDDANIRPLFKQGLTKLCDLKIGTIVTGAVSNMTTFGCFVDIGVGHDALIHISKMGGKTPNIGDRVSAYVLSVNEMKKHIQLRLENIL